MLTITFSKSRVWKTEDGRRKRKTQTYNMRGHLVIFAKILSSNQVLWDSFSPLENKVGV